MSVSLVAFCFSVISALCTAYGTGMATDTVHPCKRKNKQLSVPVAVCIYEHTLHVQCWSQVCTCVLKKRHKN